MMDIYVVNSNLNQRTKFRALESIESPKYIERTLKYISTNLEGRPRMLTRLKRKDLHDSKATLMLYLFHGDKVCRKIRKVGCKGIRDT